MCSDELVKKNNSKNIYHTNMTKKHIVSNRFLKTEIQHTKFFIKKLPGELGVFDDDEEEEEVFLPEWAIFCFFAPLLTLLLFEATSGESTLVCFFFFFWEEST
jgi:hypothetical protein